MIQTVTPITQLVAAAQPIPTMQLAVAAHNHLIHLEGGHMSPLSLNSLPMKFSKYNTFQPIDDKVLGFNTYSRQFMVLEPLLHELVEAAVHSSPEELAEVHPDFYDVLVNNGFIIGSEVDELELVEQKLRKVIDDKQSYRLIINPTMNCNFKCWYCYETHIKDSKMDDMNIIRVNKFVENVLDAGISYLQITFFGGEPLLYYKRVVVPILEHAEMAARAKGIPFGVDFTTNGYLIEPEMITSFRKFNANNFQITLDGHKQLHDNIRYVSKTKGSYDKILENIILLADHHFDVNVRINYTKENIGSVDNILDDLSQLSLDAKSHITISLHKVWQENELDFETDLYQLIENMKIRIHQLGLKNIPAGSIDAISHGCYADKRNHATVNYNGDVFKCTARDFETKSRTGVLNDQGTIEWDPVYKKRFDIRLKNKPCLDCSILPICGGGCSQLAIENEGKDYCVNDFEESKKMNIVKDMFMSSFYV
jgi:uncharacterized protein